MTNLKINEHLQKQLARMDRLPGALQQRLMEDFHRMSKLGISNDDDQRCFFFIANHVPQIIYGLFGKKLPKQVVDSVVEDVYKHRKYENRNVSSMVEFMNSVDKSLKSVLPQGLRPKLAYPSSFDSNPERPIYNLDKWVESTESIYALMRRGKSQADAKKEVLGQWDKGEVMDYNRWLRYYQERVPDKYPKLASLYVSPTDPGYFVPNDVSDLNLPLKSNLPRKGSLPRAVPSFPLPGKPVDDVSDLRTKIETQRSRLISRLNAAEKLLYSMDGQLFAGDDQELMLKMLQDLKRRIQTSNKLSAKSSLFEDFIYRTANYLHEKGKEKAAGFFYKIAQDPLADLGLGGPPSAPPPGGAPPPPAPGAPGGGGGDGDKEGTIKLLSEFFNNLKTGLPISVEEDQKQSEKVPDKAPEKKSWMNWDDNLVVKAQDATPAAPVAPPPPEAPPAAPEAPAAETPAAEATPPTDNTDDVIENALGDVSMDDIINRLEMLVGVYNKREISRQLAVLDIMMDKRGLSAFFPALGEAQAKALEANQYIGSRLEGVLTKLKGSVQAPEATNWIKDNKQEDTSTAEVRQKLTEQQEKEEQRREMRKQKELEPKAAPAQPVGEVAPEIQEPARVEQSPAIPVR